MAFTLTGALATAFKFGAVNIELMAIGSVLYLIWSLRIKELNLMSWTQYEVWAVTEEDHEELVDTTNSLKEARQLGKKILNEGYQEIIIYREDSVGEFDEVDRFKS